MAEDFTLKTAYSGNGYAPDLGAYQSDPYIMSLFQQKPDNTEVNDSGFSKKEILSGAARSAQSAGAAGGGLGGMLTSGGMSAGLMGAGPVGWGVMGGGMLLSALEKNKAEKAAREQQSIDNEMARRQNLITLAREAAGNDFRIA